MAILYEGIGPQYYFLNTNSTNVLSSVVVCEFAVAGYLNKPAGVSQLARAKARPFVLENKIVFKKVRARKQRSRFFSCHGGGQVFLSPIRQPSLKGNI